VGFESGEIEQYSGDIQEIRVAGHKTVVREKTFSDSDSYMVEDIFTLHQVSNIEQGRRIWSSPFQWYKTKIFVSTLQPGFGRDMM
jgi:hypothetical protein